MEKKRDNQTKLTAAQKRFVHEMHTIAKMSLKDLMHVEDVRMPIAV
jgi:hypothetical protein